ncbi:MAG TPA: hypothetical protein VF765_26910 [Polyangiaceae bacterium]
MRRALLVLAGLAFASATSAAGVAQADEKQQCLSASDQGQSLRDEGKYRRAREAFATCARPVCPAIVQHDCVKWLADLEATSPSVVVNAKDDKGNDLTAVKVTVDGSPLASTLDGRPVLVDPGEHTFRYETDGFPPVEEHVVIHSGEKSRVLTVQFGTPAAQPAGGGTPTPTTGGATTEGGEAPKAGGGGIPTSAWVFGGIAVAAFATEAYFGITGLSDRSSLENGCGKTQSCAQSDVDSVRTKFTIADIALAVGVVSAGLSAYFFLTHHGSDAAPAPQSAHVDFAPLPGGGGAAMLGGRF